MVRERFFIELLCHRLDEEWDPMCVIQLFKPYFSILRSITIYGSFYITKVIDWVKMTNNILSIIIEHLLRFFFLLLYLLVKFVIFEHLLEYFILFLSYLVKTISFKYLLVCFVLLLSFLVEVWCELSLMILVWAKLLPILKLRLSLVRLGMSYVKSYLFINRTIYVYHD